VVVASSFVDQLTNSWWRILCSPRAASNTSFYIMHDQKQQKKQRNRR